MEKYRRRWYILDGAMTLERMEKAYIKRILFATGGNRKLACRILGINRSTLYRKLKQWGDEGGE